MDERLIMKIRKLIIRLSLPLQLRISYNLLQRSTCQRLLGDADEIATN